MVLLAEKVCLRSEVPVLIACDMNAHPCKAHVQLPAGKSLLFQPTEIGGPTLSIQIV